MPKAGPKKRRAKAEEAAIRAAVEEHGRRGKPQPVRKAGRVRTYSFKSDDKKKPARKLSLDPTAQGYNVRNARAWQPWEEAILFAEPGMALDALTKAQAVCEHKALSVEQPVAILGDDRIYRRCPSCQAILRWWGSYTATLQAEWMSLRVTGYDMPEWGEMFTKDKSLWLFILEEAQAAITDEEV